MRLAVVHFVTNVHVQDHIVLYYIAMYNNYDNNHFQSHLLIDKLFSHVEKLTNQIDNLEAKCLYCKGKMDTLIATLQEEVTQLTRLNDETENTLLLSVAGLKHVRVFSFLILL